MVDDDEVWAARHWDDDAEGPEDPPEVGAPAEAPAERSVREESVVGGGKPDPMTAADIDLAVVRSRPTHGWQFTTIGRAATMLRRDRVAGYVALLAVVVLTAAVIGFGGGARAVVAHISDTGAWLPNDQQGSVTHANGTSGKPDARVGLRNAQGHKLKVIQEGDTVLIVDTVTGTVTRIDPSQLTVTQSVSYGAADIQIVANGTLGYAVDPAKGLVQRIDPKQLSVFGTPLALQGRLAAAGLDGQGTLWVPVLSTGQVVPVTATAHGSTAGTPVRVGQANDQLDLTIAGGKPVVTDATRATMTVLSRSGGQASVNLPSTGSAGLLVPAQVEGPLVPLVVAGSHQLVLVNTASNAPTTVNLTGTGTDDLGVPQVLGNRVYVPDDSTGRLIVYDATAGQLLNQVTVTGRPSTLDLFVKDGLLWANNADGPDAVSIDRSGSAHPVGKYRPQLPGGSLTSARPSGAPPIDTGNGGTGTTNHNGGTANQGAKTNTNGNNGTGPVNPPRNQPSAQPPSAQPPSARPPSVPPSSSPPAQPPDQPPGSVTEQAQSGSILVQFTPATAAAPTGYTLTGTPAGATVTPTTVPAGGPYQFTVTGLSCDQQYPFTVAADYPSGQQSATGAAARPCVAPQAPSNLNLDTGTPGQITASWGAPSDTGGGAVTYAVSWNGGSADAGTATSHTITGLANGSSYTVTVSATNAAGTSNPSATKTATLGTASQTGHIGGDALYPVNVRSGAGTNNGIVHTYPVGDTSAVQVTCQQTGGSWVDPTGSPSGDTWYKVSGPYAGYIATGYVTGVSGVPGC